MQCPACHITIAKVAREGGVIIRKPRYVRLTSDGKLLLGCPECRTELQSLRGRLVLFRKACAKSCSTSLATKLSAA